MLGEVRLVGCTAKWRNDELHAKLKKLADTSVKFDEESPDEVPAVIEANLTVKPGEIVAVIGRVGCGKSSLLNAIMKQIYIKKGSSEYHGSIAYIS